MDPIHESGPWTRSKVGVHGPLVHVLSSPVIASMRSMVFKCLDNFLCFSLSSRTSHYENTQCYFSVGLPRTVCAFVSLTLDNILQQYVPRNTVAK